MESVISSKMNATSLYVSTCRLVLQANPEDPGCWTDLYRLIPYLRQSLSCTVCGNLLIEPYTPTETNCQHHVCRTCKGGKKKLKPSCSWCKNYEKYVENVQLRILLQCYKKLCEYIMNSSMYRLMCKSNASSSLGDANIANMTELIQEGAGFKDEFKSNTGLSKSAYSILPCIYASASTQTIIQNIGLNNDGDSALKEEIPVTKSSLSNGSSIYSVSYAGSGNKMVIKRKAMLNKGEMENCENLRLIKGTNFKRPIHRRGRRSFKVEDKTNNVGNNTNSSTNISSVSNGKINIKKKKLGCRCGNATASPGKLTCCGQRCPCYVDSKACLDCKCRGCRNPHTKEGQKVIREPLDSTNSKIHSPVHIQADDTISAGRIDCNKTESSSSQVHKKYSDVSDSDELSLSSHRKEITITIESVENIDYCHIKEIMVKIEFLGEVLTQSEPTPVLKKNIDIGLTATINAVDIDHKFLDDILGNPVLFKIFECNSGSLPPPPPPPSSVKTEKDIKKKASKTSESVMTVPKSEMMVTVLGVCNLDLSKLVMGKRRIREILNIESEKKISIPENTHCSSFPRLVVVACSGDEKLIPDSVNTYNNVIGITVESVYNLPSYIPTGTFFDAIIPVPSLENKTNNLVFPNGEVVNEKAIDNRKRWLNLLQVEGPGGKSKYEISLDSSDIFNTVSPCYELEKGFNKIRHLIQWNIWRNCLMLKADSNYFLSKLMKYKIWPIEIIAAKKPSILKTPKSDKKSKPVVPEATQNSDRFVAFLNLSSFLYPGVTKVRVASQLYTYSQSDLINKFGADFGVPVSQPSVVTVKSKTTSERSKALAKEPENKNIPGSPVYNEEGLPVFIVVEVELWKPFTPKKDPDFLEKQLKSYLCLKGKPKKKEMNFVQALENFSETIKNVVSVLSKEYYNYIQLTKSDKQENESFHCFLNDFLYRQKNFQEVKNSLENKIITLIAEKYGRINKYNEMLPEIYVYLVEEMHKITNNFIQGQSDVLTSYYNTNELQLYAEEALEEDEYELAREYLILKLSRDKSNPEYWLDYAVFCIKTQNYETAIETVREVLCLDINNRMGLLLYALLMTKISQGAIAEMVFQTLLTKYPDFIEGWMVLHLFYITVKSTEGEDVSFQMVMKLENEARCNKSKEDRQETLDDEFFIKNTWSSEKWSTRNCKYGVSSYVDGNNWNQPLSWTTFLCPANSATVRTAVLMLQLGFYGHASMALAKSLVLNAHPSHHPPHYFYYQAVCYYLENFYDEALSQLEVPIRKYGKDCSIWGLMGHCFYKLNDVANAIACYEYVLESYNRPDDIHLIYSRMGSFYLKTGKYPCAKKVFTIACKYSPTPRMWMGAGIACLRLGEYEEAETAFSEANYLDNKNSETWAYLALVNALLQRVELSRDCYAEARKRNLTNENLKEEIESCLRQYYGEVEK